MTPLPKTETRDPLQQMREVALQVFQEQRDALWREIAEGEIGRLRHTFEEQFRQVWTAIQALTEAQRRAEERLSRLEATVQALAEAQRRAEERLSKVEDRLGKVEDRLSRLEATVQALAEAQRRTEERLNQLAEAQRRTEEALARLAEAQRRTEERLDDLDKQFSTISNILGLDAEGDAEEILTYVLERKGYRLLAAPYSLDINGEVDLVVPVETPEGVRAWVVLEAKKRVRLKELRRWAQRLRSKGFLRRLEQAGVTPPLLFYLFGLRIYAVVDQAAEEEGIGVLSPDGERVAPRAMTWETLTQDATP